MLVLCLFGALLLLTGCSFAPPHRKPNQPLPPNWDISQEQTPQPAVAPKPTLPIVPLPAPPPPPAVLHTNVVTNAVPDFTEETWIGLNHWAEAYGFAPAVELSLAPLEMTITNGYPWQNFPLRAWVSLIPLPTFLLQTTNGSLTIQSETHEAHWNDVEIHLGFAPELVQGEPLLHTLDFSKTIDPLLHGLPPLPATNRTILLDPDPPANEQHLPQNIRGRDFALDWALRLVPLLESNGWTVWLTHTNESQGSLADRIASANAHRPSLFLTLCFGLDGADRDQEGLGTYCLTPTGMPSSIPYDLFEQTWPAYPNNAYDVQNWQYAFRLQRALIHISNVTDHGLCRSRSIEILRDRMCPAVCVCGGYQSNPHDAALIATPLFRQQLAETIASALK